MQCNIVSSYCHIVTRLNDSCMQSGAICGDCSRLAFCAALRLFCGACSLHGIPYHVKPCGAFCGVLDDMRVFHAVLVLRTRSPLIVPAPAIGTGSGSLPTVDALRSAVHRVPVGYNVRAYVRCLTPSAPPKLKRAKSKSDVKK